MTLHTVDDLAKIEGNLVKIDGMKRNIADLEKEKYAAYKRISELNKENTRLREAIAHLEAALASSGT